MKDLLDSEAKRESWEGYEAERDAEQGYKDFLDELDDNIWDID